MKHPISLIALTFLFSATLVSCSSISTKKATVQTEEANLGSAQAYNNRGFSYSAEGKDELALADFNQAIKINPNYAEAYNNRGKFYDDQGKYELALADYNQAIKIDPNDAYVYNNRAWLYAKQGKDKLARTDLEKAKQLYLAEYGPASVKKIDRILKKLP